MDQYQVYSNMVNMIGDAEVTLTTVWRDTVLVGVAPRGGVTEHSWLSQGEFIEIDNRRWVLLDLKRAQPDEPEASALMIQLVAVAPD